MTRPGCYRTNVVKPFCPCDTGRPQDCQPEDWPGAHAEPPCLNCGRKRYAHFGASRFCERPSSWPPCRGNPDSAAHERIEPLDAEEWHCSDCGDTGPFPAAPFT